MTNNNYDEEKQKILYEKLKTRIKFNKRSYKNYSQSKENKKLRNILSPDFIRNFDPGLAKAMENNKVNKLTKNQSKNLYFISDLNIFDSIDTLNEKKDKKKEEEKKDEGDDDEEEEEEDDDDDNKDKKLLDDKIKDKTNNQPILKDMI